MATPESRNIKSKVLEILRESPAIPYSIIGNELGVTGERVRQIARQNGYPQRNGVLKQKICPVCGEAFNNKINIYCSRSCGYKARRKRIVLNCHQCGKPLERAPGIIRNKSGKYFCCKGCFRRWFKIGRPAESKIKECSPGDFEYEIGLRDEFPLRRITSPE